MTDGEPEPFRMSTDPADSTEADVEAVDDADAVDDAAGEDAAAEDAAGEDAGDDPDVVVGGVESIADLIDEATRTAADQTAREAAGEVPEDRSADVWGDGGGEGDVDAVWAAAQDASSGDDLWGTPDADEDVWSDEGTDQTPPPSADPTTRPGPAPQHRADRPAAAEGMDDTDADEPATFTFPIDDDDEPRDTPPAQPPAAHDAAAPEEPEPFRFEAGPGTSAPAQVPDHVDTAAEEEPEAFTFAVDEDAGPPSGVVSTEVSSPGASSSPPAQDDDRTDEADVQAWTDASDDVADGDEEPAGDVWTFDVSTATHEDDGTETPLAESATPRDEAGWHDLDAEDEPGWTVPDLPPRRRDEDGEEEPGAFTADVDDDAPWSSGTAGDVDDDAPWSSGTAGDVDDDAPWTSGAVDDEDDEGDEDEADGRIDLPADVVTAEVHDALGDLLGNGDDQDVADSGDAPITAPVPAQDTTPVPAQDTTPVPTDDTTPVPADDAAPADGDLDRFDELDDLDLDLDQFDDLEATTEEPADEPPSEDDDTASEDAEALDAPTAARQVMEPGSVTFSSGGKKKKRGLFG